MIGSVSSACFGAAGAGAVLPLSAGLLDRSTIGLGAADRLVEESAKAAAIAVAPVRALSILAIVIMHQERRQASFSGMIIGVARLAADELLIH
jgi:hypothetical protein